MTSENSAPATRVEASDGIDNLRVIKAIELTQFNVLESESVFAHYDLEMKTAVCIKALVKDYPLTDAQFRMLLSRFQGQLVQVDNEKTRFGNAIMIEPASEALTVDDFLDGSKLYKFSRGLLESSYKQIVEDLDLDAWFHVGGPLPAVLPICEGISSPHFNFSARGTRVPLHRENWKLGAVNYLAKGQQKWIMIPPERTKDVQSFIKDYLKKQNCDIAALDDCPSFLQHKNLYFEPEFLKEKFGAVEVNQKEGQVVFVYPGIYHQLINEEPGLAIAYNSAPRIWHAVAIEEDCQCSDFGTSLRKEAERIRDIKENVTRLNNHTQSVIDLARRNSRGRRIRFTPLDRGYYSTIRLQTEAADRDMSQKISSKKKKRQLKAPRTKRLRKSCTVQTSDEEFSITPTEDGGAKSNITMITRTKAKLKMHVEIPGGNDSVQTSESLQSTSSELESTHDDCAVSTDATDDGIPASSDASDESTVGLDNRTFCADNGPQTTVEELRDEYTYIEKCLKGLPPRISRHFQTVLRAGVPSLSQHLPAVANDPKNTVTSSQPVLENLNPVSVELDKKRFKCSMCGKGFGRNRNRIDHQSKCGGLGSIKCSVCNLTCKTKTALISHKKIHAN